MLHVVTYNHCSNAMVNRQHALPAFPRSDNTVKTGGQKVSNAEKKRQRLITFVEENGAQYLDALSGLVDKEGLDSAMDQFARKIYNKARFTGHYDVVRNVVFSWLLGCHPQVIVDFVARDRSTLKGVFFDALKPDLTLTLAQLRIERDLKIIGQDLLAERENFIVAEHSLLKRKVWLQWNEELSKNESPVCHVTAADTLDYPRATCSR